MQISKNTMDKLTRVSLSLSVVFIFLGLILRFVFLGRPFSYDELFTVVATDVSFSFKYLINNIILTDTHPPLYYFIVYVWNFCVRPVSEISLRLPSLFFSITAVFVSWKYFPKRLGRDAKILFCALTACSFSGVFYAQDARQYALVTLLSLAATLLYIEIAERIKYSNLSSKVLFSYLSVSVLLSYTHYFGAVFCTVMSFIIFLYSLREKKYRFKTFMLLVLPVLFLLPWLYAQAHYNLNNLGGGWWGNNVRGAFAMGYIYQLLFTNWAVLYLILIACSLSLFLYHKEIYKREFLFLLGAGGLFIAAVLVISLKVKLWEARYYLVLQPALFLLAALILEKNRLFALLTPLICILCLYTSCSWAFSGVKPKDRALEASAYIMQNKTAQDGVYLWMKPFYPAGAEGKMFSFYLGGAAVENLYAKSLSPALEKNNTIYLWSPVCFTGDALFQNLQNYNYEVKTEEDYCITRVKK